MAKSVRAADQTVMLYEVLSQDGRGSLPTGVVDCCFEHEDQILHSWVPPDGTERRRVWRTRWMCCMNGARDWILASGI